jgi:hypothetical protein
MYTAIWLEFPLLQSSKGALRSESEEIRCKDLTITMIVINFLIFFVMLVCLTCYWYELKQTLFYFGDAVASYLESEEEATKGMCLADKQRASITSGNTEERQLS